uniref:Mechanosensitive ion channel n=1 Tax=uncultured miscellaneous Crenarchaeota group TaxID=1368239 RepID=W8RW69_9ARCH|nr:mechanosensitive ion channel [uncultured miscellaneous Crenarchaeota group]
MAAKIAFLLMLLGVFIIFSYFSFFDIEMELSSRITQTAGVFAIALIIDILAARFFLKYIGIPRVRFIVSKIAGYVTYLIALIVTLAIWVEQAQNLLFAVGVIGAGIAIALQKPITNLVGFLVLLTTKPYSIGDRIEIDGEAGDVIDIGFFFTKMMEIGKWTKYDQFTGRIKTIPNSLVLEKVVNNYSKDFGFIWEELMIPVTYASNIKKARGIMVEAAQNQSGELIKRSKRQLRRMTYKYLVEPRDVNPVVYVIPTDDWIELRLRFIVDAKHRRSNVNPVFESILENFSRQKDIRISSKTTARIWDAGRRKERY